MWKYEKRLQFPINITTPNAEIAKIIITQYGGPDGELAASMRYLSQRYTMPDRKISGLLTDIGTEELGHFELIGAIVYQLTKNLSMEEIEAQGFAPYYVDHTLANSKVKVIRLLTFLKIWLQNKKHEPLMITFFVW